MKKHIIRFNNGMEDLVFDLEDKTSISREVTFTDHPTSIGTPRTDHAYRNPIKATISGTMQNVAIYSRGNKRNNIKYAIELLENAQNNIEPVSLITREKTIPKLYINNLSYDYDSSSNNTLKINCELREIIEVKSLQFGSIEKEDTTQNTDEDTATNSSIDQSAVGNNTISDELGKNILLTEGAIGGAVVGSSIGGAVIGSKIGITLGSIVPGAGTLVGAGVGALVGIGTAKLIGAISSAIDKTKNRTRKDID